MSMNNRFLTLFIFFFTFGVYLHTLSPTVGLSDSGELTTCAYLLSIAHATGYPLYLLSSKLFTFLPFGEVAFRVNLVSAVFGGLTCSFVFLIIMFVTQHQLPSLIGAFCLGFSPTFWILSTTAEVYTLNSWLLSLLTLIYLIWTRQKKINWLYLFFFIFGLSLGNHLTIILFLPLFLYFIIKKQTTFSQISKFTLFFLIGLSIYLYLPLRSAGDITLVNWNKVTSWSYFFYYVTGAHFKKLLFSSSVFAVVKHLWNYFLLLITHFPSFAFGIGIIGLIKSFSLNRRFSLLISSMWLVLVIFCINYDISDIWSLYLPTYLFFSLFIGVGISFLIKITFFSIRKWLIIIIIVSLFFSYQLSYSLFEYKFNKSKYFFPLDFCSQVLAQANHHSLIISNWRYAGCLWYVQYVCRMKEDIKILTSQDENFEKFIQKYPSYSSVYSIHPQQEYFLMKRGEVFKICQKEFKKIK